MMGRLLRVFCCLGLASSLVLGQTQPAERVFWIGDLTKSQAWKSVKVGPPLTELMNTEGESRGVPFGPEGDIVIREGEDTHYLEQFLRLVDPVSWGDQDGVSIEFFESRMRVRHSPKMLEQLGQLLDELRRTRTPKLRVQLHLVPRTASVDAEAGALTKAQVDRLKSGKVLLAESTLQHGIAGQIRTGRHVAFLGDFDVEVAQEARIAQPVIRELWDGLLSELHVGVLSNGDVCVQGRLRLSELTRMRDKDCEAPWLGRLQLPTVGFHSIWASGCFESGGGLLVGASGVDSDHLILISATRLSPVSHRVGRALVVPTSLSLAPLSFLPQLGKEVSDDDAVLLHADEVQAYIRHSVPSELWDDSDQTDLHVDRRGLILTSPTELHAPFLESLKKLEAQNLQTGALELRYDFLSADASASFSSEGEGPGRVAAALDGRILTSSIMGTDFQVIAGSEQLLIPSYQVEIASKSQIADPQVQPLFSGVWFRGNLSSTGASDVALRGEFLATDPVQEPVSVDPKCTDVGVVELFNQRKILVHVSGSLTPGSWSVIHAAKHPGQEGLFVLVAKLRK